MPPLAEVDGAIFARTARVRTSGDYVKRRIQAGVQLP